MKLHVSLYILNIKFIKTELIKTKVCPSNYTTKSIFWNNISSNFKYSTNKNNNLYLHHVHKVIFPIEICLLKSTFNWETNLNMSNTKRIEFLNMDAFNSNTFRYHVRIIVSLYFDKTNKKYNFNYE